MGDARRMPDGEVDALAKEIVEWYIEWNPIFATYVGIHDHDHRLPSGTYEAELEERGRAKEYLRRLEALDRKGLSAGKRVDWGNVRNPLRLWMFESVVLPNSTDTVVHVRGELGKPVPLGAHGLRLEAVYDVGRLYVIGRLGASVWVASVMPPGTAFEVAKELV